MLGSFELLVFEIELVPLVLRIEIVCVDNMIAGPRCRFKDLVGLTVVGLEEALEVEVGVLLLLLSALGRGGATLSGANNRSEHHLVPDGRLRADIVVIVAVTAVRLFVSLPDARQTPFDVKLLAVICCLELNLGLFLGRTHSRARYDRSIRPIRAALNALSRRVKV